MGSLELACRRCGVTISVDKSEPLPPDFPFCSERCRMVDLGAWFDEDYKFTRGVHEADLDQGE